MRLELESGELNTPVAELGLSQRTAGALLREFARRRGLDYHAALEAMRLGDVLAYHVGELRALRHFGERSLRELEACLSARGLALRAAPERPRRRPQFIPAAPTCRALRRQVA